MLGIILILVLVWAGLVVLLWAGSVWFQGYIYSEPSPQLAWGAPVAGTVLVLFLALWCVIQGKYPGRYPGWTDFSAKETTTFRELWAVKSGKKTHYTQGKDERGRLQFLDGQGKQVPNPVDEIIVQENGEEIVFKAERDEKGNYKRGKVSSPLHIMESESPLRYLDGRGRAMKENELGELVTFLWGRFLVYLFLNLFHLGLWFVCLWLLLRFQWSHALGLAVIFWLISTVLVVPTLLAKVETAALSPRTAVRGLGDNTTRCA